ncbi:DNAJ heat shock family protein [Striga asiatica]|uniref:DNAJ heat shock family protein n=1 Tax=Striga asiatica TaxID=4170 RepID=A0A5A7PFH4_STRAF|nr:DNAJ heat shock family protein [Striga asiatica]
MRALAARVDSRGGDLIWSRSGGKGRVGVSGFRVGRGSDGRVGVSGFRVGRGGDGGGVILEFLLVLLSDNTFGGVAVAPAQQRGPAVINDRGLPKDGVGPALAGALDQSEEVPLEGFLAEECRLRLVVVSAGGGGGPEGG